LLPIGTVDLHPGGTKKAPAEVLLLHCRFKHNQIRTLRHTYIDRGTDPDHRMKMIYHGASRSSRSAHAHLQEERLVPMHC
jgi:hypothetical protein